MHREHAASSHVRRGDEGKKKVRNSTYQKKANILKSTATVCRKAWKIDTAEVPLNTCSVFKLHTSQSDKWDCSNEAEGPAPPPLLLSKRARVSGKDTGVRDFNIPPFHKQSYIKL